MKSVARPGRPYKFRSRRSADTEVLAGGPPGWRELRDAALSFQSRGHTASAATIAEHLFKRRR